MEMVIVLKATMETMNVNVILFLMEGLVCNANLIWQVQMKREYAIH